MRKILLAIAIALLTLTPLRVLAATPGEFHASLLRRGITAYDAGRYQDAVKSLRLAAFGLVEAIEQYQTAHAYLALAYDKLKDTDRARDSLRRVIQAERVERRFGAIAFPPEVRTAVLSVAGRVLPVAEVDLLRTSPVRVAGAPASTPPVTAPQTSTTTTTTRPSGTVTTPSQPAKPPAVSEQKPVTQPATQPATQPPAPKPASTQPQPAQPRPVPSTQQPAASNPPAATPPRPTTPPAITATELANRLLAAERALNASNLTEARRVYRELLNAKGISRDALIRVAEGFYRARDFAGALAAFDRTGGLRRGEEPYRYYIAVAAYETGQLERARRELAAALPFIEITPDVARYKAKIEGALN